MFLDASLKTLDLILKLEMFNEEKTPNKNTNPVGVKAR